jgi:hypothetical protein
MTILGFLMFRSFSKYLPKVVVFHFKPVSVTQYDEVINITMIESIIASANIHSIIILHLKIELDDVSSPCTVFDIEV